MPRSFNPPNVWKPFSTFSMGVVQGDGRIVHLKGQFPLDIEGCVVGAGDMQAQVRRTFENIRDTLAYVGGEMRDLLTLTYYVTDIRSFMATQALREEFLAKPYPVTSAVQVAGLFHRDVLIEIAAVAEVPRDRYRDPA